MDSYVLGSDVISIDDETAQEFGVHQGLVEVFGDDPILAEIMGAETSGGPYVTIHVKDVPKLVQQKGGQLGSLVANLLPSTIEGKVYGDMQKKIADGLKAEGVDAEVKVVSTRPFGTPYKRDFLIGMGTGAASVGVGYGLYKLFKALFGR